MLSPVEQINFSTSIGWLLLARVSFFVVPLKGVLGILKGYCDFFFT
jgi:hypothetical protein